MNTHRTILLTDWQKAEIVRRLRRGSDDQGVPIQRAITMMVFALLQRQAGFAIGGTMHHILRDLGMLTVNRGNITKKGRMFLYECYIPVCADTGGL